jgi:membrane carboxypeptidase/penicillin-binding protein
MAEIRKKLCQLLKGRQLYSDLYDVYTEVLHDLTAVLKKSVVKGKAANTTLLNFRPMRNSASREDESGYLQTRQTTERSNQQHPPWD